MGNSSAPDKATLCGFTYRMKTGRPCQLVMPRGKYLFKGRHQFGGELKQIKDDDEVNKKGKKAIGLDWQNNNSARASRFFVHFFAVAARLRRENAYFHVLWRTVNTRRGHSFSFPELRCSLLEFNSRKKFSANVWRIERNGISAIKFDAAWLHFFSDVFISVVVD